jgi:DNA-binding MarR family transcriptional regulator
MTSAKLKSHSLRDIIKRMIREKRISFEARCLWLLLETHTRGDSWVCCVGMKKLADESGHSLAWVKRHMKELQDQGFIRIGKRVLNNAKVNEYALISEI